MRQLVDSYNGMWNRRNKLESILRSAAENDALTGLPNRYCFERDCDMLKDNNGGRPLALLMFDVNFLKLTNDTKGHLAGDRLIRTAAECIKESFGNEDANNCYRIGGDEFVAMIVDCQEKDIQRRISRFEMIQQRERITVSVGYSYTENMDATQFKKMMSEADDRMYEQKKQIHAQHKNNGKKEEN